MPFDESHVDDDLLALLALGETAGTTADLAHIEECERCTDELASLTRRRRPRALRGRRRRARRARAAGLGPRRRGAGAGCRRCVGLVADVRTRCPHRPRRLVGLGAPPTPSPRSSRSTRVDPRAGRWIAAAAAVGLVVGGGATWWIANQPDAVTVIATAVLEPLPGWDATGSAVVETLSDGSRVLVVDLDQSESSDDGFREVWLLKPDVSGLVSLGTLDGSSGRFDLPAGLDLDQFSVVDVSEEQFDGDPAHSGDSIVRGPLEA